MRKKIRLINITLLLIMTGYQITLAQPRVITLRWEDVAQKSLDNNISLKSTALDYKSQKLTKWQAVSAFAPSVSYGGYATQNLELSVMTLMGQKFRIGTEYNFQHSLEVSLPIFTGFSRIANLRMQNNLEKSLKAELSGKEDETLLNALQAYYQIMLADKLIRVNQDASDAAQANLEQVQQFFQVGAASELDLKRAEAQYYTTLPSLESARNQYKISQNQLKFILNLSLSDSLVIEDSLDSKNFIGLYKDAPLAQLEQLAWENRPEIKQIANQTDAVKNQKTIAMSQSLPTIALSAGVSHVAMKDDYKMLQSDYNRSKSVSLSVQWPLFQGGKTALEYQKARIQQQQMEFSKEQVHDQVLLDVEQSYYTLNEALKNLTSLKASLDQANEALRLSNLMYKEGMSTQVEVLDTQLQFTQNNINYQQGLYNYNISQLNLLKSIGKIKTILH